VANLTDTIKVRIKRDGEVISAKSPVPENVKIVIIINSQVTDAPNTTQIASGAGLSSAAGNNAAIDSSNTLQQQGVGAQGEASNRGQNGEQTEPHTDHQVDGDDADAAVVIVVNDQRNRAGETQASATQVASGGGSDSAAGTNAAIESSNTKQQHAVGGAEGGTARNRGQNDEQEEE